MSALRRWWASLTVAEKRYLGAGVLGLAGIGVYALAARRRETPERGKATPEEAQAVEQALAELGRDANPNDAADIAYWELHPECPHWLDPADPAHDQCIDVWLRIRDEARFQLGCRRYRPDLEVYPPGSQKQIQLFRRAAKTAGVPESWASDPDLRFILAHESGGVVGIPNYTYGWRAEEAACWPLIHEQLRRGVNTSGIVRGGKTLKSTATGLGQLTRANAKAHYPRGTEGIGDALEEAVGMLRYIKRRYGTVGWARRCYGKLCDGKAGRPTPPTGIPKRFLEGY